MKHFSKKKLIITIALLLVGGISFWFLPPRGGNAVSAKDTSDETIEEKIIDERWMGHGGELEERLIKTLPNTDFGGVWMSDGGRIQVGVVNTSKSAGESRKTLLDEAKSMGLDEGTDIVSVKYSWATLLETRDAIHELHQKYVDYKNGAWPIQMGIMTDLNKVEVHIPANEKHLTDGHYKVLSEIEEKYKDQVFFIPYDNMPQEYALCNWWFCNNPLRGGVGLQGNISNYNEIDCTAGFMMKTVVSAPSVPSYYVLTAGHCEAGGGQWWGSRQYDYSHGYIGGVQSGHNVYTYNTNFVDAMIIKRQYWDFLGAVLMRSGPAANGLNSEAPPSYNESYKISNWSTNVKNDRVCVSGAINGGYVGPNQGGSCGKVHAVGVNYTSGGKTTVTNRAGLCGRHGDSGAPVFSDKKNLAYGIIRGGNDSSVCNDYIYFTPLNLIIIRYQQIGINLTLY